MIDLRITHRRSPRRHVPEPISQASLLAKLRVLLGGGRAQVAVLASGSILAGLTESAILAVLAQTAAAMVSHGSHVQLSLGVVHLRDPLAGMLVFGLALVALRLLLQIVISVVPAQMAADLQTRLRTELLATFTSASWQEQSRDREGLLQELLTNQTAQASGAAMLAATLVVTSLTFVVMLGAAVVLNPIAAIVVVASAAGLFALLHPLSKLTHRFATRLSQASLDYAGDVNEIVRVAEESQVFGTHTAQRERSDRLVAAVHRPYFRVQTLARLVPGIYQSLVYLLVVLALGAIYLVANSQAASLGAVVLLLVRAGMYGQQAQGSYQGMLQTIPYLEQVWDAQARYESARRHDGEVPLQKVRTVSFAHVSYSYTSRHPVLSGVDFHVAEGETIGIVGPSGAGKSTVIQILLGLRAPDSGLYLVNGVPASAFARLDWMRLIAYVPQEPRLLHASVAENIAFFRPLDESAIHRAARQAEIHDDIVNWSTGYDTVIGPRADGISGGQQQRICLARALVGNPSVLVLDEPTSALDPLSEQAIQKTLVALKNRLTLFIAAHRMSTLDICDRVLVIVGGQVEAFGPPAELTRTSSYFRSASRGMQRERGIHPVVATIPNG